MCGNIKKRKNTFNYVFMLTINEDKKLIDI